MQVPMNLTPDLLIGRGRDRLCYRHPNDPDFCIKVAANGPEKQTRREKEYFLYLLRKGADLRYIAPYMGEVETSMGTGGLFPLVRNDNGEVSRTLSQSIHAGEIDQLTVENKLNELYCYLLNNGICTRDISPNNIMVRRRGEQLDFILIDGVSSPGHNPLTIRLPALVKRAIDKSWESLMRKVKQLLDTVGSKAAPLQPPAAISATI